jgi:hypothetical protein
MRVIPNQVVASAAPAARGVEGKRVCIRLNGTGRDAGDVWTQGHEVEQHSRIFILPTSLRRLRDDVTAERQPRTL